MNTPKGFKREWVVTVEWKDVPPRWRATQVTEVMREVFDSGIVMTTPRTVYAAFASREAAEVARLGLSLRFACKDEVWVTMAHSLVREAMVP